MDEVTQPTDPDTFLDYRGSVCVMSEGNQRECWQAKHTRGTKQTWFVKRAFQALDTQIELPCIVILSRLYPRLLDDDNLIGAFKKIRDEVAWHIFNDCNMLRLHYKKRSAGQYDSSPLLTWQYAQEKSYLEGARIQILRREK